jgi:hypothetical protein
MTMNRRGTFLLLPLIFASLFVFGVHYVSARYSAVSLNLRTPVAPKSDWGGALPGDTTFRPDGNPHNINTDLVVPTGVTLTIEPGVELLFSPDASLIVHGRLLAEGTPTQSILFTRRYFDTYWGAIAIIDSQADNRIAYAVIEYTSEGLPSPRSHGVSAYNSRLTLADSVLRYTQTSAGVIADSDSTIYLLRNEIHDIQGDAVHPTGGLAVIQGNHIYNARWGAYFFEGIEIRKMSPTSPAWVLDNHIHDVSDDCLDVNDSWVIVERNRLHHCADKGISIGSGGGAFPGSLTSSATVINNLVYSSAIGIAVKDNTTARLVHNTIVHNATGLTLHEAHDHPGLGGGHAIVINSILWANGQAIFSDALSTVDVAYSDVEGGWPGEGNIDADPSFEGIGDFHLGDGSPAVNAGRDEGVAVDLDGKPRLIGPAPDMGVYERQRLLDLRAWPGDEQIHLAWQVAGMDLSLYSFAISYTQHPGTGSTLFPPVFITGLPTTTFSYTVVHVINNAWYTVVVEGRKADNDLWARSEPVFVLATDRFVFLPLTLRLPP